MVATSTPAAPAGRRSPESLAPEGGTARPRLYAIDGLRFLAALAVVVYHFAARWSQVWGAEPGEVFPEIGPVIIYGVLGPELFFVISGFAILMTAWGRDVPHVIASRVARLYPSYWIAVIATSVLLLWIWPAGKDISVGEALVNLTMFQEAFGVRHVDGVYWTLWTELRFYGLMVLFVAWGITRRRLLWACALWPLAAHVVFELQVPWLRVALIEQYAPFFAGGMLIYLMHRQGQSLVPWLLVAMNAGLAVRNTVPWQMHSVSTNTVFTPNPWVLGVLTVGCFAVVAVLTLTRVQRLPWAWLLPVGALTYPLYLIHEFWGWWVIDNLAGHANRWVVLGAAVAVSMVLAWLVHQVEKRTGPPFRRWIDRTLRRRPAPVAVARRRAPATA
ncbi:peptidoglycan/LPS O-acetylase OafA/YrhL [Georgenia soli]|uniref:Peptidoglycan/LPS O-acetylase OafA/YrhL n=1 Tax=Georgenia soli TaxID=638953 RepID=A0A2A9EKF7_9MICO|nr:acyltransferase [Georgenia soli]PFG38720.1 peptidoglycan/LPS O-acetylase OafA/YrhL [Georgenia soli]